MADWDGDWRTYTPPSISVGQLHDLGFPDRLLRSSKAQCVGSHAWEAAEDWWNNLAEHLTVPRGLTIWENEPKAMATLCVMALRMSFWGGLPVARGVRVSPAFYVESMDLGKDAVLEEARNAGTLLVAGVGTPLFGPDRTLEILSSLAQVRQRMGCLTFWHLSPAATPRSAEICDRLVKVLGDTTVVVGKASTFAKISESP